MRDEETAEIWKTLEDFGTLIAQAQGFNRAYNFILMEIVLDIARSKPDPKEYVKKMYEHVSARADLWPVEHEAHPPTVEFRDAVERFFLLAGKYLT